ncbi:MAG: glutamine--fructose-6-phosphate transaminase (isomerizing) [Clostridia bacterium]|nr:glutamine--fructose-6-phosphate transaminase (isomerizing) [Clostridia bacterium]
MCGIVGYIGKRQCAPILLDGLGRLAYRGYDSAGMAVLTEGKIQVIKAKGRLSVLEERTKNGTTVEGSIGIAHTRWATHGEPSDVNSHPHISQSGKFAVVHNGIIENYRKLRTFLTEKGFTFMSETDTEVFAHLIEYYYNGNLVETMWKVMRKIEGSYALGVLCDDYPDSFLAVRKDSPLIVGIGEGENFIASDVPAILKYTKKVCYLEDNEIVVLKKDNVTVYNADGETIDKEICTINWDVASAEKGGYEHFMFKEIMEQSKALQDTIHPRIKDGEIVLDNIVLTSEYLNSVDKIFIVACGSAYHVGVAGKYVIESLVGKPTEVDLASEFRYRNPIVTDRTLIIIISQSGETADTIAAMREAKRLGGRVISIVNVVGSTIAKESDEVLYTWAGPEIAVATTKAYSTQLACMYLLGIYMSQKLGKLSDAEQKALVAAVKALPEAVEKILSCRENVQFMASRFYNSKNIFFIGRNLDYAVALEGSLKLKEISYIHSEAYAAGELKHGTISLIEDGTLVVAPATGERLFDKMLSNIREVKARGAVVMAIAAEGNTAIAEEADYCLYVPKTHPLLTPSLTVIPMQLFGYYVASIKGCDIDKPRNLAKSVTVE